jgi:hypothetical protein
MQNMQNMQNMQDVHSELAVQQRIDFSVVSGNKFGQDLLERVANTTMNHEIVPKPIDRLRRAQKVSARRKIVNMQNMQNMINMQNMYLGTPGGAINFRAFSPSSKSGRAPSTRCKWPIVQWSIRS